MARPFLVTSTEDLPDLGTGRQESDFILDRQQSELQPGQIRVPVEPPTPMETWTRAESNIWDAKESDNVRTPLTGYGRGDLWKTPTTEDAPGAFPSSERNERSPNSDPHHRLGTVGMTSGMGSRESSSFGFGETAKRSPSQVLSDELYEQATTYLPPPPPRVPIENRRQRAELWYYFASKWDITHRSAPPPRSPLPGMEEEIRFGRTPMSVVPYRGDKWLERCNFWFDWTSQHFRPKVSNPAAQIDPEFVLQCCGVE